MMVTCFLPCRKGSERVVNKNIKPFAGFKRGLIEIKLQQLKECPSIDEIILSTNDDEIIEFAESQGIEKMTIHRRDDELCSSTTSTDKLVQLASEISNSEHILWTHVTSPFFTSSDYTRFIESYFEAIEKDFDSIFSEFSSNKLDLVTSLSCKLKPSQL